MPTWNDLLNDFQAQPDNAAKGKWLIDRQNATLKQLSQRQGGRNVVVYASAFLQKPQAPAESIVITAEDLNGLMSVIVGMNFAAGLTLILHTPGGATNAAETLVAYLRTKFFDVEVIVPTLAMSAGTMISLAANRITMGRQSQLGPIDPQMAIAGRYVSARAVVDQFDRAKREVLKDVTAGHVWAPILGSLGPALLQEAQNALDYGESMVAAWLSKYMFQGYPDAVRRGKRVARHFNDARKHKSHGRRIDRDEARALGVTVMDLEASQDLQDDVLTAYHLTTIMFEQSPTTKLMWSHSERSWLKNWIPQP